VLIVFFSQFECFAVCVDIAVLCSTDLEYNKTAGQEKSNLTRVSPNTLYWLN